MLLGHLPLLLFKPKNTHNYPNLSNSPEEFATFKPGHKKQYVVPLRSYHTIQDILRDVRHGMQDLVTARPTGRMTMQEYNNIKILISNKMVPMPQLTRYIMVRTAPVQLLIDLKIAPRETGTQKVVRNVCEKLAIVQEASETALAQRANMDGTGNNNIKEEVLQRRAIARHMKNMNKNSSLFPTTIDGGHLNKSFNQAKSGPVGLGWHATESKTKEEKKVKRRVLAVKQTVLSTAAVSAASAAAVPAASVAASVAASAASSSSSPSSSSSSANKVSPTDGSNKRSAVHVESVQVQAPQKRSKTQGGEGPLIL
jgi:hypothetical protein